MRLVFLGVVFASLAVCSLAASDWGINLGTDMPSPRVPHRVEDRLHPALNDRAGLLFRALDKDHDKFISKEDVEASQPVLNTQMPGITVDDFLSFMQAADKDKDNKLSRKELFDGLATGMDDDEQTDVAPSALLESQASLKVDRRRIHEQQEEQEQDQDQDQQQDESDPNSRAEALQNVQAQLSKMRFHQIFSKRVTRLLASRGMNLNAVANKVVSFVKHKATKFLDFLSGSVKKEEGCVMCQYIVQRCEANVKLTGINNYAFLELDSSAQGTPQPKEDLQEEIPAVPLSDDSGAPVMLETQAETKTKTHGFDDQAGAAVIASAHTSTRTMRQQERVRFNEIYRVVDLTLDDVCEQGMPNTYYGYCKQIYKSQVSLVDGLRYQYRSADICFRIGMCTKKNYLAKDMHSRYKSK